MNEDLAALKTRFEPKEEKPLTLDRQLNSVRFTECGRFLLAAGHDSLVHRFDVTGEEVTELNPLTGFGGWVQKLALPTADNVAVTGENTFAVDSWGQLRCSSFAN